ncbi:MAG: hypothetical protein PHV34_17695 [Verrucomicrobiae bacterium]|nr:hypothetical protein [Verrucomicrobiae bacterium]
MTKPFVGNISSNHAPLGNGRVMALLQQYQGGKPNDRIHYLLYPDYSRRSSVLGEAGVQTVVFDPVYGNVNYDFYESGGFIALDDAVYEDGCGLYTVESHRGFIRMRTTTWVALDCDAVVRRIQVASMTNDRRELEVFPQVHLRGEICRKDGVIISKVPNEDVVYVAAGCESAEDFHFGDIGAAAREKKFNHEFGTVSEIGEIRVDEKFSVENQFFPDAEERLLQVCASRGRKPNLSFLNRVKVGREWSEPFYLVIGLGKTEREAVGNLKSLSGDPENSRKKTRQTWACWNGSGKVREPSFADYEMHLSKTIMKMAIQDNGLAPYIGFRKYHGMVWLRDSLWMSIAFSEAGYREESLRILRGLKQVVKKDANGYIYCIYDCKTGEQKEDIDSAENDFAGLLLAGIFYHYRKFRDQGALGEFMELIAYCADWICQKRDETGLLPPCSGIWECFTPRTKGYQYEHMTWASGTAAYGLRVAAEMCGDMKDFARAEKCRAAHLQMLDCLKMECVKDGILCRAKETVRLDSSVLLFFTLFPLFDPEDPVVAGTVEAIESRLKDPLLGGIWRHEDMTYERGDGQPWIGTTLWMAETHMVLGNKKKGDEYLQWVLEHTSQCGLFPEEVISKDLLWGISMPSYSHAGFVMAMLRARG